MRCPKCNQPEHDGACLRFFVHGKPITQGSGDAIVITDRRRSKRRCGCVGQYVPDRRKELYTWRRKIASVARDQLGGRVLSKDWQGPYEVALVFYLRRGKTVKRFEPDVAPDLDKLQRAVLDALAGVIWNNDGQVTRIVADKEYGQHEGVAIEVSPRICEPLFKATT